MVLNPQASHAAYMPSSSWWVCDRETFHQRLQAEQARMQRSKFGALATVTLEAIAEAKRA